MSLDNQIIASFEAALAGFEAAESIIVKSDNVKSNEEALGAKEFILPYPIMIETTGGACEAATGEYAVSVMTEKHNGAKRAYDIVALVKNYLPLNSRPLQSDQKLEIMGASKTLRLGALGSHYRVDVIFQFRYN